MHFLEAPFLAGPASQALQAADPFAYVYGMWLHT